MFFSLAACSVRFFFWTSSYAAAGAVVRLPCNAMSGGVGSYGKLSPFVGLRRDGQPSAGHYNISKVQRSGGKQRKKKVCSEQQSTRLLTSRHAQPFQVHFVEQSKAILHSAITNQPLKLHEGVVLAAHDDVEGRNKFVITVDTEPAQGPLSVTLEHASHPHLSPSSI